MRRLKLEDEGVNPARTCTITFTESAGTDGPHRTPVEHEANVSAKPLSLIDCRVYQVFSAALLFWEL
jgi:hypothetical protein